MRTIVLLQLIMGCLITQRQAKVAGFGKQALISNVNKAHAMDGFFKMENSLDKLNFQTRQVRISMNRIQGSQSRFTTVQQAQKKLHMSKDLLTSISHLKAGLTSLQFKSKRHEVPFIQRQKFNVQMLLLSSQLRRVRKNLLRMVRKQTEELRANKASEIYLSRHSYGIQSSSRVTVVT